MNTPINDIKNIIEYYKVVDIKLSKMFINESNFNSMLETEKCKNKRSFYRKYKKITGENCPVRIIIIK